VYVLIVNRITILTKVHY